MSADDKDNHERRGEMAPEERDAFRRRSEALGEKLDRARHRSEDPIRQGSSGTGTSRGAAMGRALRVSAELIGGIVVGSAIGWFLDGWLGNQKPWFFVLFFLLGAAAGILNVIRMAMRERTPRLPSVTDERDEDK